MMIPAWHRPRCSQAPSPGMMAACHGHGHHQLSEQENDFSSLAQRVSRNSDTRRAVGTPWYQLSMMRPPMPRVGREPSRLAHTRGYARRCRQRTRRGGGAMGGCVEDCASVTVLGVATAPQIRVVSQGRRPRPHATVQRPWFLARSCALTAFRAVWARVSQTPRSAISIETIRRSSVVRLGHEVIVYFVVKREWRRLVRRKSAQAACLFPVFERFLHSRLVRPSQSGAAPG